jgi:hypothetical protein
LLKILRVGIVGDDMLDVQLNNGNILMLELAPFFHCPSFAPLREDDRILYPKTDGDHVYWRDGPRLSVDQLMRMLQREKAVDHSRTMPTI